MRTFHKRKACAVCGYPRELHIRAFANSRDKKPAARLCRMEHGYEVRTEHGPEVLYPGRVKLMRLRDEDIIRPVSRPDAREYELARRRLERRGKLDGRGDVVVDENVTAKLQIPLAHDKRRKILLEDKAGDRGRKRLARGSARRHRGELHGAPGTGIAGYPRTVGGWKVFRLLPDEQEQETPRRARPFGRKGGGRYRQMTR